MIYAVFERVFSNWDLSIDTRGNVNFSHRIDVSTCFIYSKSTFLSLHQHIDFGGKWSLWNDCRQKQKQKHTYTYTVQVKIMDTFKTFHRPWESMLNGMCCCDSIKNDKHIRCSRAIRDDVWIFRCFIVVERYGKCCFVRSRTRHTHNGSIGTVWACRFEFYVTHRRKTCV